MDDEMDVSEASKLFARARNFRGLKLYYLILLINASVLQSQCSQKVLI